MSCPKLSPSAIVPAKDNRFNVISAVIDALEKHLAKHKAARGQDFWQSGAG